MIDPARSADVTLHGGASTHAAAEPTSETPQIVVYHDGRIVRTLPVNVAVVTIGRSPANVLPLPNASVSRLHAELRRTPEAIILTDVGSVNGTYVGDTALLPHQPLQLAAGALIRIGPFVLRFEDASARPAPREDGTTAEQQVFEPLPIPPATYSPPPPPRPVYAAPVPHEPVSSYLDFLPVIFQDGDFLGRYLLIFQSIWELLEYRQDHIAMYFDPRTCSVPFLSWLAEWLGLPAGLQLEEGRMRQLLGEAVELHRWRGTAYGLTRLIEICTGITPLVAESAANASILHIRVAVPPDTTIDREAIERLIRVNKPAHTAYLLEVV
jgi:phage tail-like protein